MQRQSGSAHQGKAKLQERLLLRSPNPGTVR